MYDKLNITENHLQALSLFTNGFDNEFYIREAQRTLKISPRTSQTVLADLERRGVIESKKRGKIISYRLKKNEISRRYMTFCEEYKSIGFLSGNAMIAEIIEKIGGCIDGIGVIFGSYAKGLAGKDSDLDVFVAGTYDRERIDTVSQTYGIDISVKCYPLENFRKAMRGDILVKEVLKSHIVFLNSEEFVKEVFEHG